MPVSPQDLLASANALRTQRQAKASRRALQALIWRYPHSDEAREAARRLHVHRVNLALAFGAVGLLLALYVVTFSFSLTGAGHGVFAPFLASLGALVGAPLSLASWPVRRDKSGRVLGTLAALVAVCVDVSLVVLTVRFDEGRHYTSSGHLALSILEPASLAAALLMGVMPWFSWQAIGATVAFQSLRPVRRGRSQAPAPPSAA